ncbi:MAG TPA: hypothetical protein VGR43_01095 [Dehalococcoidia bacterium]|jgi:hypothetical protein|nr:hypothetical protein [Dehalococcoidia bacterium]
MLTCDSCRIGLGSVHLRHDEAFFCCAGCAGGGPCVCTYEHDLRRYPPALYALPVSLTELLDRYENGIQERVAGKAANVLPVDHEDELECKGGL